MLNIELLSKEDDGQTVTFTGIIFESPDDDCEEDFLEEEIWQT